MFHSDSSYTISNPGSCKWKKGISNIINFILLLLLPEQEKWQKGGLCLSSGILGAILNTLQNYKKAYV